jgi:hypothetical protein
MDCRPGAKYYYSQEHIPQVVSIRTSRILGIHGVEVMLLYNTNINLLNHAYSLHPMNVMKGAVFLLGETEAVHSSTQYLSDLQSFFKNLKMDTTCITDDTPFVWGGIAVTDASVHYRSPRQGQC